MIDSEWKKNYLAFGELEALLAFSKRLDPDLKIIVTISARHFSSMKIANDVVKVVKRYENAGLNLVAGNRVYLTQREKRRSAAKALTRLVKFVIKELEDSTIFIGTEGLVWTTSRLAADYGLIPFLLLDKNLEINLKRIRKITGNCSMALYVPYLMDFSSDDLSTRVLERLWTYALRRGWVKEEVAKLGYDVRHVQEGAPHLFDERLKETLLEGIKFLSVYGGEQEFAKAFQKFSRLKINVIVGLPLIEEEAQVKAFGNQLCQFRKILSKVRGLRGNKPQ